MIKKTIGIATILLLILAIVLALGVGGAKASTGSVQLRGDGLRAVALQHLGDFHSKMLVKGMNLDSTLDAVGQHDLLQASARGDLSLNTLLNTLQQGLALGQTVYTLDSYASVSGVGVDYQRNQNEVTGV